MCMHAPYMQHGMHECMSRQCACMHRTCSMACMSAGADSLHACTVHAAWHVRAKGTGQASGISQSLPAFRSHVCVCAVL